LGVLPLVSLVPRPPFALLAALGFAILLWATVALEFSLHWIAQGIVLSLLLLPPLVFVSSKIDRTKLGTGLAYLGVVSLAIYVMHTMFSAALRILLVKLGIDDLMLHLVLGGAIGIVGPVIFYGVARRYGALRYLGLG
jgi:peptidoglycan/LPS O-acetylase OafA/YrhL